MPVKGSSKAWEKMSIRYDELARIYPKMKAIKTNGKWSILGGSIQGASAFISLTVEACKLAGFTGSDDECLHWWLERIQGR